MKSKVKNTLQKFFTTLLAIVLVFGSVFSFISIKTVYAASNGGSAGPVPSAANNNAGVGNLGPNNCNANNGKICNPIKAKSLTDFIINILGIVKLLAGIALVFYFMWAGFKYVTARGDETAIKDATRALTWTAVGGAILLGAEVIARLMQGTINELGSGL